MFLHSTRSLVLVVLLVPVALRAETREEAKERQLREAESAAWAAESVARQREAEANAPPIPFGAPLTPGVAVRDRDEPIPVRGHRRRHAFDAALLQRLRIEVAWTQKIYPGSLWLHLLDANGRLLDFDKDNAEFKVNWSSTDQSQTFELVAQAAGHYLLEIGSDDTVAYTVTLTTQPPIVPRELVLGRTLHSTIPKGGADYLTLRIPPELAGKRILLRPYSEVGIWPSFSFHDVNGKLIDGCGEGGDCTDDQSSWKAREGTWLLYVDVHLSYGGPYSVTPTEYVPGLDVPDDAKALVPAQPVEGTLGHVVEDGPLLRERYFTLDVPQAEPYLVQLEMRACSGTASLRKVEKGATAHELPKTQLADGVKVDLTPGKWVFTVTGDPVFSDMPGTFRLLTAPYAPPLVVQWGLGPTSPKAVVKRIAFVEVQKLLRESAEGKDAAAKLAAQLKSFQERIDARSKARLAIQDEEEKHAALTASIQFGQELQVKMQADEERAIDEVAAHAKVVLAGLRASRHLDAVIDSDSVLWGSAAANLTGELIAGLDRTAAPKGPKATASMAIARVDMDRFIGGSRKAGAKRVELAALAKESGGADKARTEEQRFFQDVLKKLEALAIARKLGLVVSEKAVANSYPGLNWATQPVDLTTALIDAFDAD